MDPWGTSYLYKYPGEKNLGEAEHGFDLFSLGEDKRLGGYGRSADFGNWVQPEYFLDIDAELKTNAIREKIYFSGQLGLCLGIVIYILGIAVALLRGTDLKMSFRKRKNIVLAAIVSISTALLVFFISPNVIS